MIAFQSATSARPDSLLFFPDRYDLPGYKKLLHTPDLTVSTGLGLSSLVTWCLTLIDRTLSPSSSSFPLYTDVITMMQARSNPALKLEHCAGGLAVAGLVGSHVGGLCPLRPPLNGDSLFGWQTLGQSSCLNV